MNGTSGRSKGIKVLAVITAILTMLVGGIMLACNNDPIPERDMNAKAEHGVYISGETTLSLNKGYEASLLINSETLSGTYALDGAALTLTFGGAETKGTYEGNVVTITYNGNTIRLLKNESYGVEFMDGDRLLQVMQVRNGDSVTRPEDPVKAGNAFIGWYADKTYTTPFLFGVTAITGATKVYARWTTETGASTFTVKFDLNYENAPNVKSENTIGGKIYSSQLSTPDEREGYRFEGWWVSMTGNKTELAYKLQDGTTVKENTTAYAVWTKKEEGRKLETPAVSVSDTTVSWNTVADARGYKVKVTRPDGTTLAENNNVSGTSLSVDLTVQKEGDYRVEVTALALSGEENYSDTAVRVYRNKALARVSLFETNKEKDLKFNKVDNATKYEIEIDCGDKEHTHNPISIDGNTTYNFSNCLMQEGGIKFTVTASADGYATSVSETYVYDLTLSEAGNFVLDTEHELSWDAVQNATRYAVKINGEDKTVYENKISLKEYSGNITVKVTSKADGYNDSKASEYTMDKQNQLATPKNVKVQGNKVSWEKVENAEKYIVRIGGEEKEVTGLETELTNITDSTKDYGISVKAVGGGKQDSLYSDAIDARYLMIENSLKYDKGEVSWNAVIGAEEYTVKVNDGEAIRITDGSTRAKITLTQETNNIEVGYIQNGEVKGSASTTVTAHKVTFDTVDGTGEAQAQYYAEGDPVAFPEGLTKTGYTHDGWYNGRAGAEGNAGRYTDTVYSLNKDVTLYANWKPNKYTVTLDYNEIGSGEVTEVEVTYGKPFTLPVPENNKPENAIYGFVGWYSDKSQGIGVQYTNEYGISINKWILTENVTIYAGWQSVLSFVKSNDGYIVKSGSYIKNLENVNIPELYKGPDDDRAYPVTEISDTAFSSCTGLVSVNIPDSVKFINEVAFKNCTALKEINIINTLDANEHIYESIDGVLFYNNPTTSLKDLWFYPRGKTDSVYVIPENVESIAWRGFYYSLFNELIIADSVVSIATEAFYYTKNLVKVTFAEHIGNQPAKELNIGVAAFRYADNLEEVVLPARYDNFDRDIFYNCKKLKKVDGQNGSKYKAIKTHTTDVSHKEYYVLIEEETKTLVFCPESVVGEVTIPYGVESIGDRAFSSCKNLSKLIIPNFVTYIGKQAFSGYRLEIGTLTLYISACENLKSVHFNGGGIISQIIGESAFGYENSNNSSYRCSKLTTVTFDADCNVTEIGVRAFSGCPIVRLNLPNSVIKLGDKAFAQCKSLTSFNFAQSSDYDETKNLSIGVDCFSECTALRSITLPYYISDFKDGVFGGCSTLQEVNVDANNPYLKSVDGVLYNKNITEIKYYPAARRGSFTLPSTVEQIGSKVFTGRTMLNGIVLSANLKEIGAEAFSGCTSLSSVTFQDGRIDGLALTIGSGTFSGCKNLITVKIPTNAVIIKLPDNLFNLCGNLSEFSIPNTVTEIGENAFAECKNLKGELFIPKSVTALGYKAFYGCSGLTSVKFEDNRNLNIAMYDANGTTVGETSTFAACSNITTVELPKLLINIGNNAFGSCSQLKSINIPVTVANIYQKAFVNCTQLYSVDFVSNQLYNINIEDGKSSSDGAFANCTALTSITLPEGLTRIPNNCFYNCSRLITVNIPSTVKNDAFDGKNAQKVAIGNSAFYGCLALKNLNISMDGSGDFSLGTSALSNCKELETLTLPNRLKDWHSSKTAITKPITSDVVKGCTNLNSIIVKNATNSDEYYSDNGMLLSDYGATLLVCPLGKSGQIEIPYSVNRIDQKVFYQNTKINTLVFAENTSGETIEDGSDDLYIGAENTTSYSNGAFYGCSELTSIVFPARLKKINGYAFANNKKLTSVVFQGVDDKTARLEIIARNAFYQCATLSSITLPSSLETIENEAFCENTGLISVEFSDGKLSSIGQRAFKATKITELTIPSKVTKIDNEAFAQCYNLTEATLPGTITTFGDKVFEDCYKLNTFSVINPDSMELNDSVLFVNKGGSIVKYSQNKTDSIYYVPHGVTEIGNYAFAYNPYISTIYIPDTVSKIGTYAFYRCNSLQSVIFESNENCGISSVKDATTITIGNYAFAGNRLLTNISLPARTSAGGTYMLAYCDNLRKIDLSACVKLGAIPNYAFLYSPIDNLKLPPQLQTIGNSAFQYSKIVSIKLPGTVKSVGMRAFANCDNLQTVELETNVACTLSSFVFENDKCLTSVKLSENISVLPASLFAGCENLMSVDFGEESKITEFKTKVFSGCKSLKSITLPVKLSKITKEVFLDSGITNIDFEQGSEIKSIPKDAFRKITSLKSIVLPEGLETIEDYAFAECTSLNNVIFPSTLTKIGYHAFSECFKLASVTLPDSLETIETSAFSETGIVNVIIPSNVSLFNGFVFEDCKSLRTVEFKQGSKITEFRYKNMSHSYDFRGCDSLQSVILPDKLVYLGDGEFTKSGLRSIEIPPTVETIGSNAFSDCKNLVNVVFQKKEDGTYSLTEIGSYAFNNTGISSVVLPNTINIINRDAFSKCSNLTDVRIDYRSDGGCNLEEIGTYAFAYTNIASFIIPSTVNTIGQNPFLYCYNVVLKLDPNNKSFVMINDILYSVDKSLLYICPATVSGVVTVPVECTEIMPEAFVASGVTEISLMNTGFTVDRWAFNACSKLRKVEFGENAIIGECAFRWCTSLVDVKLGAYSQLGSNVFLHCTALETIFIPDYCEVGGGLFDECDKLNDINIGENVTVDGLPYGQEDGGDVVVTISGNVGEAAFKGNLNITSVIIEEGVTSIEKEAFAGCTNLVSVKFPSTLTEIKAKAFEKCVNLVNINLQETALQTIGVASKMAADSSVFDGCSKLENVVFPETLELIGTYSFRNTAVKEIFIPKKTVLYSNGLSAGGGQFSNCKQLEKVTIEDGTASKYIPNSAFYNTTIKEIYIPEGITTIGDWAFRDWVNPESDEGYNVRLTSVTIPKTVTRIGEMAFGECKDLISVVFAEGSVLERIDDGAFSGTAISSISLPASIKTIGSTSAVSEGISEGGVFARCGKLENVSFEKDENENSAMETFGSYVFQSCSLLKSIVVPASTVTLGEGMFMNCSLLESVVFEKDVNDECNLKTISNNVFVNTNLSVIELPSSISKLGKTVFSGTKISSVELPLNAMIANNGIGDELFAGMNNLTMVTIPDGAKYLSKAMFSGCTKIPSVIIPETCITVGEKCFNGWTEKQTVYIKGLKTPFSAWNVQWNYGCNANIVWNWSPEVTE